MMVPLETLLRALRARNARYEGLMKDLEDPAIFSQPDRVAALQKERGALQAFHELLPRLETVVEERREAEELRASDDPEMQSLGESVDIEKLEAREAEYRAEGEELLLSDDGLSHRDVILEIRGGTGGEEAALFAADLFRMYGRYAEQKGWKIEVLDLSESERGGFKEIVAQITGPMVYRFLKFESGGHRVQRVPETETSGRIHTSLATVAVLPKAEEVDISWKPDELRIDTMRAGGPGGQKVNKTESAVRLTHLPTGIMVKCQDEKSQHKNRSRAESILRAKLFDYFQGQRDAERAEERRSQVGSGDRSEKIRTYNFAQDRVTDHRAGVTVHSIDRVMAGELDPLMERLLAWDRERSMKAMVERFEREAGGSD